MAGEVFTFGNFSEEETREVMLGEVVAVPFIASAPPPENPSRSASPVPEQLLPHPALPVVGKSPAVAQEVSRSVAPLPERALPPAVVERPIPQPAPPAVVTYEHIPYDPVPPYADFPPEMYQASYVHGVRHLPNGQVYATYEDMMYSQMGWATDDFQGTMQPGPMTMAMPPRGPMYSPQYHVASQGPHVSYQYPHIYQQMQPMSYGHPPPHVSHPIHMSSPQAPPYARSPAAPAVAATRPSYAGGQAMSTSTMHAPIQYAQQAPPPARMMPSQSQRLSHTHAQASPAYVQQQPVALISQHVAPTPANVRVQIPAAAPPSYSPHATQQSPSVSAHLDSPPQNAKVASMAMYPPTSVPPPIIPAPPVSPPGVAQPPRAQGPLLSRPSGALSMPVQQSSGVVVSDLSPATVQAPPVVPEPLQALVMKPVAAPSQSNVQRPTPPVSSASAQSPQPNAVAESPTQISVSTPAPVDSSLSSPSQQGTVAAPALVGATAAPSPAPPKPSFIGADQLTVEQISSAGPVSARPVSVSSASSVAAAGVRKQSPPPAQPPAQTRSPPIQQPVPAAPRSWAAVAKANTPSSTSPSLASPGASPDAISAAARGSRTAAVAASAASPRVSAPYRPPGAASRSSDSSTAATANGIASWKPFDVDVEKMALDDARDLFGIFTSHPLSTQPVSLVPRGLVNNGNMCFMNVILQVLTAMPPFYNLLTHRNLKEDMLTEQTPWLKRFFKFIQDFQVQPPVIKNGDCSSSQPVTPTSDASPASPPSSQQNGIKESGKKKGVAPANPSISPASSLGSLQVAAAILPEQFFDLLSGFSDGGSSVTVDDGGKATGQFTTRQEDAQEFLNYVLDKLHEEILAVLRRADQACQERNGDLSNGPFQSTISSQWEEVGKKNRISNVHSMESAHSPISAIFGGKLKSIFKKTGAKSSVTYQPFHCLPLDLESKRTQVKRLEEALEFFVAVETLEDYLDAETKQTITATKQVLLDQLPLILVLHLKRFTYHPERGPQKVDKQIRYPLLLDIKSEWIGSSDKVMQRYTLFSVISHHGKQVAGGHYTCDIRQPNGDWLKFDDDKISRVPEKDVLTRQAYLLFYQRERGAASPASAQAAALLSTQAQR